MANGSYYQNLCNFVPMKRYFLIFLLLSASLYGKAQQEIPSVLPGKEAGDTLPSYLKPVTTELRDSASAPRLTPEQARVLESLQVTLMMPSPFSVNEDYDRTAPTRVFTAPGFVGFTPWQNAVLHVSGASESLPGLMGIEQGTIGFSQTFGRLSLDAFASATHYGYFRGIQTSYGFGGSLSYQLTDRLSLTVFGSYYTNTHPLTPAMAGYMNASAFGGYASYDISDHWGISVGAQTTRSTVTNRWETQPIVMPYYKINKNAAIQVDVGGILYNMIRSKTGGYRRGNPTIGPPVGGPPPVAPRK